MYCGGSAVEQSFLYLVVVGLLIAVASPLGALFRKRTLAGRAAVIGLAASVLFGLGCSRACSDTPPQASPVTIEAVVERAPRASFTECRGEAFQIDLIDALSVLPIDTLEAQREQVRDWIWTVTMGRIAEETSAEAVLSGLMAEPLFRSEELEPVLDMPVGATRSALLTSGDAIVMVESTAAEQMRSDVLEAVDREALELGHMPEHVLIYRYEIQGKDAIAEVCLLGRLDRSELEGGEHGWKSALITTEADLAKFLAPGVDLLSARFAPDGLRLTGRTRPRSATARVTPEHIAALILRGSRESAGFSLDPVTSRANALKDIAELLAALPELEKFNDLSARWGQGEDASLSPVDARTSAAAARAEAQSRLSAARDRLKWVPEENIGDILTAPSSGSPGDDLAAALLMKVWRRNSKQCARYIGPLERGTEAAMTFLYTDLLMKLWRLHWNEIPPDGDMGDFGSRSRSGDPADSCEEDAFSHARIWLGPAEEGYERDPLGGVQFAPAATRIFASSRRPGSPGQEDEPGETLHRFVHWWNQHYFRVAEWEPQYEILNQLMKWSVVLQMAELEQKMGLLLFLDTAQVRRDRDFERWIAETPRLTWRGPVDLVASAKEGEECLPLFGSETSSPCGGKIALMGGISGGTGVLPGTMKPARPLNTPRGLWRLGREAPGVVTDGQRVVFPKIRRAGGDLTEVAITRGAKEISLSASIAKGTPRQGFLSWRRRGPPVNELGKSFELSQKMLNGRQRTNGLLSAELTTSDLARARVHVSVTRHGGKPLGAADQGLSKLEGELAQGRLDSAEAILGRLRLRGSSVADVRAVRHRLLEARVRAGREGRDVAAIARMDTKLSVSEGGQTSGGALESYLRAKGAAGNLPVLAPVKYPVHAGLPPAAHPAGKVLAPSEKFVSRIVYESTAARLPSEMRVGEVDLGLRTALKAGFYPNYITGSAFRLVGAPEQPVIVVVPCREAGEGGEADENTPPCHEPPPEKDRRKGRPGRSPDQMGAN
jgi:hypothetical protein